MWALVRVGVGVCYCDSRRGEKQDTMTKVRHCCHAGVGGVSIEVGVGVGVGGGVGVGDGVGVGLRVGVGRGVGVSIVV